MGGFETLANLLTAMYGLKVLLHRRAFRFDMQYYFLERRDEIDKNGSNFLNSVDI